MSDVAEFLLARYDEDEAVARKAISASTREWVARSSQVVTDDLFEVAKASVPTALHMARHDPARVLADCEAHRGIVGLAKEQPETFAEALRWLAEPYADHPDYRQEWRP